MNDLHVDVTSIEKQLAELWRAEKHELGVASCGLRELFREAALATRNSELATNE